MLRKHLITTDVGAFGLTQADPTSPTFLDVAPSGPYCLYVQGPATAGPHPGVGGGKLAPDAHVTREQMVAIIARWWAGVRGVDLSAVHG